MTALPSIPTLPPPDFGAAAPLAEAAAAAGRALSGDIRRLVEAGGPALNPASIRSLQSVATSGLVGACGGLAPAVVPVGGGTAFAPSGRFLNQAIDRLAVPGGPNPADVACRLLGKQGAVVNPGMLAQGPENMLSEAVRRVIG